MKRSFLLLILVIGMLLFSACGTPETIEQPAQSPAPQQESPVKTTPASTPEQPKPPSAAFTITSFDQTYSDLLKQWESVYINYKIQNNGEAHITFYRVYFTITFDDGSQYQGWTNGSA